MYGNMPTSALRKFVRRQTRPYSIDRQRDRDESTVGGGEVYESDVAILDLHLYGERGSQTVIDVGEVDTGSMGGVALPSEDVRVGDRLEYGDRRYEVVSPIRAIPDESDTSVVHFNLEHVDETTANTSL